MIEFHSQNTFELSNPKEVTNWIEELISNEGFVVGDISYVFCDDSFLLNINQEFLDHDTYTDIISFNYSLGKELAGEIYVSTDRVLENANTFGASFESELHRVIAHGVLHFCGYEDGSEEQKVLMRKKEEEYLQLICQ
ncbi:MAG: rRNA maturation RNase YbeY [Bacteroidota bacterium]